MDIDYIHGDTLVSNESPNINVDHVNYSIKQLLVDHPQASKIELGFLLKDVVYRFTINKELRVVAAKNGQQLSPINKELAIKIAKENFANKTIEISNIQLIKSDPPKELSGRHLPVWRIDFDDFASSSFYISTNLGQLVTKRHSFWRVFDWMFSFHVMDYIDEEADNKLLLFFTVLALLASIFGLILTYFRLAPKHNKQMRPKNKKLKKLNRAEHS